MAFRHIPTMSKSPHGGNMSLMNMLGFCHDIPTIENYYDDQLGFVNVFDVQSVPMGQFYYEDFSWWKKPHKPFDEAIIDSS